MEKRGIKKENAVTLLSLVITIIVILILAGISVSLLMGPNGLIEKAKLAGQKTEMAAVQEKVQFKLLNLNTEKLENEQEEATLEDVLNLKFNDEEITDAYDEGDNVVLIIGQYECKISKELKVESISSYHPEQLRKVRRDLTFCSFEEKDG